MSGPDTSFLTYHQALAVLGLPGPVDHETTRQAFLRAVKAARPDHPAGDAERFREVIAAWHVIQAEGPARPALAPPLRRTAPLPTLSIDPMLALNGGPVTTRHRGRTFRLTLPAGLRAGEHVRLKGAGRDDSDLFLALRIRAADGLSVLGDDLFMQADVSPRVLQDGGRVEVLTHAGPRNAWVVAGLEPPVRLRLKGLGLPARGRHGQGHLFITLTPAEEAPSAAEHLLDRFARVWTTPRLAA